MNDRPTYAKLAIYISRDLHLQLKLASIGERRSLSDFTEGLLRDAMRAWDDHHERKADEDRDDTG
jgi:hypothetical protein